MICQLRPVPRHLTVASFSPQCPANRRLQSEGHSSPENLRHKRTPVPRHYRMSPIQRHLRPGPAQTSTPRLHQESKSLQVTLLQAGLLLRYPSSSLLRLRHSSPFMPAGNTGRVFGLGKQDGNGTRSGPHSACVWVCVCVKERNTNSKNSKSEPTEGRESLARAPPLLQHHHSGRLQFPQAGLLKAHVPNVGVFRS